MFNHIPQPNEDRAPVLAECACAALAVVLLHAVPAYFLLRNPFQQHLPSERPERTSVELLHRTIAVEYVEYLPPPLASNTPSARTLSTGSGRRNPHADAPHDGQATTPKAVADPASSVLSPSRQPAGLDLRLPDTYHARTTFAAPDTGNQDKKAVLDFRETRFNKRWGPDGGEIQHAWAAQSAVARVLLSATGALIKPCTEAERMRREPRCGGGQYEGDER